MIAIFCLAAYSCKQGAGSGSSKNTTLNGFKYQLLNDAPGETAKEGDYVYFRYNVKNNDSIIFSSTSQDNRYEKSNTNFRVVIQNE